jgi:7-cyano-7-deazaguanine synthase
MTKKDMAIVLVSGGIDSCLTIAMAAKKYELAFLHLSYGQKTEKRELKSYKDLASCFKVKKRLVASVKYLKDIGGSSITDKRINVSKAGMGSKKSMPSSYVPFFNTNLFAIAVAWGEILGAGKIFIGVNKELGARYPDCTPRFFNFLGKVINEGTKPSTSISVETPLITMKKKDVVIKACQMKLPLHLTWSCYKNNDIACGECDGCFQRLKAFKAANLFDPLEYMVYPKI